MTGKNDSQETTKCFPGGVCQKPGQVTWISMTARSSRGTRYKRSGGFAQRGNTYSQEVPHLLGVYESPIIHHPSSIINSQSTFSPLSTIQYTVPILHISDNMHLCMQKNADLADAAPLERASAGSAYFGLAMCHGSNGKAHLLVEKSVLRLQCIRRYRIKPGSCVD